MTQRWYRTRPWLSVPRPTVLSDPYADHGEEACHELLEVADDDLTWVVQSDAIVALVRNQALRQRAADVVTASDLYDPSATYWRDLFTCLDLEPQA